MGTVNYKKASSYYFIGNIFNKGIAFLTVPIFTRILSEYDYGIVNTYNSWIGILAMIMGFALHTGIRLAYVDYKDRYDEYMSVTVFFTIIVSLSTSAIVFVGLWITGINTGSLMVIMCLLQSAATALLTDYSCYLMMKYEYRFRTILMILPNLLSAVCSIWVIIALVNNRKYLGRIIPTALITVAFAVVVVILVFSRSKVLWKKEYLAYGLKISAPLIVHGIALSILSQSDRIMITWLADASQTGIYSLVYNFSMIATVVTTSLEGVWMPWFYRKMKEGYKEREIEKVAKDYVNLMTYTIGCLTLVAPEIVKVLADKAYWEGIVIIPPVVLVNFVIFMYSLYVDIEHYHKCTVYITVNTTIAAIVNLVLNFIFIPQYGYIAAAYTTLGAYIVSFIMHSRYARKLEKDLYPITFFFRAIIHLAIICVIFYLAVEIWWIRWLVAVFYFIAMFMRERKRIFEIFPGVKTRFGGKR